MIVEAPDALRTWLTKEMAPICDAEPTALAKYVLALLRKDKAEPDLMEFCIEQLDVFLQTKARPFVERLFKVIKERSYMPKTTTTAPAQSSLQKAIKASSLTGEKKRDIDERKESKEKDDEKKKSVAQIEKDRKVCFTKPREDKEIEKGAVNDGPQSLQAKNVRKRISPSPLVVPKDDTRRDHPMNRIDRRRSRSPRDRRLERTDRVVERRNVNLSVARAVHRPNERHKTERVDRIEHKRSPYERSRREKSAEPDQRKKKRCRDYDEKGYCMKGDQCIYDHGPDPVVVDDIALEKMVSSGTKPAPTIAQVAPNFSVPPPGYTPINPPPPGVDSVYATNANTVSSIGISEGYNPEAPALSASSMPPVPTAVQAPSIDFSVPPPPYPTPATWQPQNYTVPLQSTPVLVHPNTNVYDATQSSHVVPTQPVQAKLNQINEQIQMTGPSRRGRGGAHIRMNKFAQGGASNRTLEVRKIPNEMNNISKLNEHFGQFGRIVNIQVCYEGDPEAALITYLSRHEAVSAYKSTEPILNNRFIKVFWHNADGQQNFAGRTGIFQNNAQTESAVTFNTRGSLTKTVHLTSRGTEHSHDTQTTTTVANSNPQKSYKSGRLSTAHSVADKERYIEVRRRRKQEKENKMRLLDLQRRKYELLTKEVEHQRTVLEKIKEATDPAKKKKLMDIFKTIEGSVRTLKEEIASLTEKLLKLKEQSEAETKVNETKGQDASSNDGNELSGTESGVKRPNIEDVISSAEGPGTVKKIRTADSSQSLDNRSRVVAVSGFKSEDENDVIVHMENFGELVDMEFGAKTHDSPSTAYFTYKKRRDAEQAVSLGSDFANGPLEIFWAPKKPLTRGVVPDEKRTPSERVTPAALLASCPLDEVT